MDQTIWRIQGNPLITPTGHGILNGTGVAVKDLFAITGYATGCGNPRYLQQATPQTRTACAVTRLLGSGAHVTGIAQTDEFAYSLSGVNIHYGTPPNPKAPDRISGGSSSGPAAAVATGQADIGLGTDTAGSLRVPAAYESLWGIRTTWGRVPTDGVHPLSPSFDTVGVLTASPRTFLAAVDALMPDADSAQLTVQPGPDDSETTRWARRAVHEMLVDAPPLDTIVEDDVREAVKDFRERLTEETRGYAGHADLTAADLDAWNALFATVRGWEAWQVNGSWVSDNWDALDPLIAARFDRDSHITRTQYEEGRTALNQARANLRHRMAHTILIIPTASSVAPLRNDSDSTQVLQARATTMRLTALAGAGGLPAVNIPLATADGVPCGACLVGPAGSDRALARLAVACVALVGV